MNTKYHLNYSEDFTNQIGIMLNPSKYKDKKRRCYLSNSINPNGKT